MKKIAIQIVLATVLSGPAGAQVPGPRPSSAPGDTAREIEAQMSITRNGIDGLLAKVMRNDAMSNYSLKDYWRSNPAHLKKIESALVRFEETFKVEILGKAAAAMNEYNSTHRSPAFTDAQKELLGKQQWVKIQTAFGKAKTAYHAAVVRAIREMGIRTYAVEVRGRRQDRGVAFNTDSGWRVGRRSVLYRCADYDCGTREAIGRQSVSRKGLGYQAHGDDFDRKIVEDLARSLRPGCDSQLCVLLRASDRLATIDLIRSLFERRISMRLADGRSVEILPEKLDALEKVAEALKETGKFDLSDLPFDSK